MGTAGGVDGVGRRLADARKRAGMSQVKLGEKLSLDKTQVSKVESGRRRLDISEVVLAADALGVSTRSLLGMKEPTKLALAARLASEAPEEGLRQAYRRARQLVEVDAALSEAGALRPAEPTAGASELMVRGRKAGRSTVSTRPGAQRQGREFAEAAREVLDLGSGPIVDLAEMIETHFGVDVALSPLGTDVDGLCVHGEDVQLIMLSSDFPPSRVRFTLAHELAHHIMGDTHEVDSEDEATMFGDNPVEWRANAFAAHLLMPERGIRRLLEHWEEQGTPSDAAVTALMQHFDVSLASLIYQLNQVGRLSFDGGQRLRAEGPARLVRTYGQATMSGGGPIFTTAVRPPSRLYRRALGAFRAQQVGLGPVATLLERPDDDVLYRELTDGAPVEAGDEAPYEFQV
jgi:Zn-dependent peptidase ImmA (M78 family)/transcriptional regulator with XRE-family HTH domain